MQAYSAPLHTASVNGVAFAPHELGLMLATASSDGSLSVLSYRQAEGAWSAVQVIAYLLCRHESHRTTDYPNPCKG